MVKSATDRTVTGQRFSDSSDGRTVLSKSNASYWKAKLKKRIYRTVDGTVVQIPNWQVRMFGERSEAWFDLGTPNREAAAAKARDIYGDIHKLGWIGALAKHKPQTRRRIK